MSVTREDPAAPRRPATSIDVAERAGVSQSTVSRALSGSRTITEATRQRVERAAQELGYHVNARAAGLRKGETGTIAIVVIGRAGEGARQINPFYYSLLGNACAAAAERGYEALVSFQSEPDEFFGHYVARRQADGLIVLGTAMNGPAWDYFRDCAKDNAQIAFWGSPFDDSAWVRSDNRAGGRAAVERLLKSGARHILFVGDPAGAQRQYGERYAGYREAMGEAGLDLADALVPEDAGDRVDQGRAAARRILDLDERPEGLFFACDAMALGALEEFAAAGVSIPDEIGVVGFDGIDAGAFSNPPLTTLAPDFGEAGRSLVAMALAPAGMETDNRVPVRLVDRGSVRGEVPHNG